MSGSLADMTEKMQQIIEITASGGPEMLQIKASPRPAPAPGEVLIRVEAAGINRPDILQRQGKYPPPPGASPIPGLEVAGTIAASTVSEWKPGDKVCALLTGGGYAEYAVAPAGQVLLVPQGLNMAEAAALPETAFTVWNNLFVRAHLKTGETVLIHGGASGIGTMAIQMATAFGAHVIATAGTDEKCAACEKLGAILTINYKSADFAAVIGDNKVDVVLDIVGGDYVARNMRVMAPNGRHVSIAVQGGRMASIDIATLMQKRLALTGSTLRSASVAEKTTLRDALRTHVWPLIEAGKIRPVIFKTFPLSQAAEAHKALEKGDHVGKIVLIAPP